MINVIVIKEKQTIKTIEATGHSGYAEEGQDIVCSAVSSLMETLANGLTEVVKAQAEVKVDESIPLLSVKLNETDKKKCEYAQILMQSTLLGLKGVANGYRKFIKIKEKQND
ncbi:MAG: ribosomal-processing cysteine protease Prp [Clostridia bacterium]|nr:ribosomal-processing cysteine protease Prp [Clostridia bacterium]